MKTKLNIALLAIKESTANELGQINITVNNDEIVVYSLLGSNSIFLNTELIVLAESLHVGCYIIYNNDIDRCEMHIH